MMIEEEEEFVKRCSDTPMDLRYNKDLCDGSPRIGLGCQFFFMTHNKKQLHRKKHSDDDDDDGSTYIRPWVSTGKTKQPNNQTPTARTKKSLVVTFVDTHP
jgi:hypothetical protein